MTKTAPLSMRLDPDLKARLKRLAQRENRSLTNFIETKLRCIANEAPAESERKRPHVR